MLTIFALLISCLAASPQRSSLSVALKEVYLASGAPLTLAENPGGWDWSAFGLVELKLKNESSLPVTVWARAEDAGATKMTNNCRAVIVLAGLKSGTLLLPLVKRPLDPGYAEFKPFFMYTKALNVLDNTIDTTAVTDVVAWLDDARSDSKVKVESMVLVGPGTRKAPPFLPFVDKYGQYEHAEWPGKIHSDGDFVLRKREELAEMKIHPGPADWDKWGGWLNGPKQKATGFFYPLKVAGRWWFVDPDGNLFWSYGPTGVGFGEGSPVTGRENWFAELPSATGPYGKYWGSGDGARYMYYASRKFETFDFVGANAQRKYGQNWANSTIDLLHKRLRSWGMNTIGNWSDESVYLRHKTPYVVAISYLGPKLDNIPDVFDDGFRTALRARMEMERGKSANDPWNIGYFVDNELWWGYEPGAAMVAHGALRATEKSASKREFLHDLEAKYGAVQALNAKWETQYGSWDAMLKSTDLPKTANPNVAEDCGAFGRKFAERYFSTVRSEVKRVAPNNLYLGCRFHGQVDTPIVQIASQYADVVSYNVYEPEPAARLNRYIGVIDRPFIVGEFGLDSDFGQTPFRGDDFSADPDDRVRKLERYMNNAFRHPLMVGAHFFQFRDQALTGRPDGEAVLRGFVNVADTPHFDLVQTNRQLSAQMYKSRSGG